MNKKSILQSIPFILLLVCLAIQTSFAQTTEFTYQGKLSDTGMQSPTYDFEFRLCALENDCTTPLATQQRSGVSVFGGVFTVNLDFSATLFPGADRWLEIAVKRPMEVNYTTLLPRQKINSAPYSIKSLFANDANLLGGLAASEYVTTSSIGNSFIRNSTTLQTGNFNISGDGFVGGNFGIGTTSPLSKLTVRTLTDNAGLVHSDGTISVGSYVGGSAFGGWYGTYSNHPLHFFTNNSVSRMTITQSGDVGIGTTVPQSRLTLQTPTNSYGFLQIDGTVNFGSYIGSASGTPLGGWFGTRTNHPLHFFTNSSLPRMTITQGGFVGIGTTAPTSLLDVVGSNSGISGRTTDGSGIGVFGEGFIGVNGVSLRTTNSVAVYGDNAGSNTVGHAGFFDGRVTVLGNLSKSGGSFKIDHPLDPANKYLYHSFVESPDMMNIYNGNVTTDASGEAVVTMPEYFAALNRDFRYQLTVIGQFAQAIVAEEIKDNSFKIRTDKPNVKVSWMVTGIRQDVYANENRIPVEEDKPATERGFYLYPKGFNQPTEKSVLTSSGLLRAR